MDDLFVVLFGEINPKKVKCSSYTVPWIPENILSPSKNYWISSIHSMKSEWIELQFKKKVLVTNIYIIFSKDGLGINTRVEGLKEDEFWEVIHNIQDANIKKIGQYCIYSNHIYTSNIYKNIRIISNPAPYLHFQYIQLFGKTT